MPMTPDSRPASSTDPTTWTSHTVADRSSVGVGLGFVLGDGVGCIDLDHCLDGGELQPWAQEILDRCPATYVEVSPSGDGLHVWGLLPEAPGRKRKGVEVYSVGRYITVTGQRWHEAPNTLADLSGVAATL